VTFSRSWLFNVK